MLSLIFVISLLLNIGSIDNNVADINNDVLANPTVSDTFKNNDEIMAISYEDGSTVSNGLQALEPKKASQDVQSNSLVADWKKDGNDRHTVNYQDGATVSNGLQINPQQEALHAESVATTLAVYLKEQHELAMRDAVVVCDNQLQTAMAEQPVW